MEIKVESPSGVKRRILITVDADRVKTERNKLFKKVRKQAQIRGFRPGKAPRLFWSAITAKTSTRNCRAI